MLINARSCLTRAPAGRTSALRKVDAAKDTQCSALTTAAHHRRSPCHPRHPRFLGRHPHAIQELQPLIYRSSRIPGATPGAPQDASSEPQWTLPQHPRTLRRHHRACAQEARSCLEQTQDPGRGARDRQVPHRKGGCREGREEAAQGEKGPERKGSHARMKKSRF